MTLSYMPDVYEHDAEISNNCLENKKPGKCGLDKLLYSESGERK